MVFPNTFVSEQSCFGYKVRDGFGNEQDRIGVFFKTSFFFMPSIFLLRSQQRIVATVEESVLRMEMAGLESQEEDAPKCVLFFKPMSCLGQISPHRRDETWSATLHSFPLPWIPVIPENPLAVCGSRKFRVDTLGDHLCTCTAHSGDKKTHDWVSYQIADLFRITHKVKTQQVTRSWGQ